MSKDARAKAVSVALGIGYAHAFRLVRELLDTVNQPITREEVVATVVARYREKQNAEDPS